MKVMDCGSGMEWQRNEEEFALRMRDFGEDLE